MDFPRIMQSSAKSTKLVTKRIEICLLEIEKIIFNQEIFLTENLRRGIICFVVIARENDSENILTD